jgi:hypothetical protein
MTTQRRRWPFFGEPPARKPRPAMDEPALRGKRVILSRPDGFVYDMRAATETYPNAQGKPTVDIVTEEHWYRWMYTDQPPDREPYPVYLVWVE